MSDKENYSDRAKRFLDSTRDPYSDFNRPPRIALVKNVEGKYLPPGCDISEFACAMDGRGMYDYMQTRELLIGVLKELEELKKEKE